MTVDSTERATRTPRSAVAVLRGLAAVAYLFISAADELVSALIGIPRMGWMAGQVGDLAADRYRRAAHNAVDAEVIDDTPGDDVPGSAGPDSPETASQHEGQGHGENRQAAHT